MYSIDDFQKEDNILFETVELIIKSNVKTTYDSTIEGIFSTKQRYLLSLDMSVNEVIMLKTFINVKIMTIMQKDGKLDKNKAWLAFCVADSIFETCKLRCLGKFKIDFERERNWVDSVKDFFISIIPSLKKKDQARFSAEFYYKNHKKSCISNQDFMDLYEYVYNELKV